MRPKKEPIFTDIGVSSIKSSRDKMQDTYSVQHLEPNKRTAANRIHIFDGHLEKGQKAAEIARTVFNDRLDVPIEELADVFVDADTEIANASIRGGTTATVVQISVNNNERSISSYWAGDSPAYYITCDDDDALVALECTPTLHNAQNESEVARMKAIGVPVTEEGRFGGIMVSRSLGDGKHYNGLIPTPDSQTFDSQKAGLLVMGSDGVLTDRTTQDVLMDIVNYQRTEKLQTIAAYITHKYGLSTGDNATLFLGSMPDLRQK